jgi:DNA-binding CsgD family transcriptional regulator
LKNARSIAAGRSFEPAVEWGASGEHRGDSEEVRLLAEDLIRAARRNGPLEGILLDVEVDGVRCVLVHRPPEAGNDVALSPREREIARMVAKGYPNKVIARVLEISSWTVSTHLRRIFAKLGVCSRAAMVAQILEEGLLGDDLRQGPRVTSV